MKLCGFFAELKRRHVYNVAVAYAVTGWLLIQVVTQVFPFFHAPNWIVRLTILLVILGFPIAVVCAWAFELTPEGIKTDAEAEVNAAAIRKTGRRLTALIVIFAVLASALVAYRFLHSQQSSETQNTMPDAIDANTIAILPFQNLSDDKSNAYFVSGMREEILTSVAQIHQLTVRSSISSEKFQSRPDDLRAVSRAMQVAMVLEGSVQKSGDNILINVRLIDAQRSREL